MFIEEIIGAGEIAISDERSTDPQAHELARLASDAHNGGMLSKKAGVTHFHVGEGESRLRLLRKLIDEYDINAEWLYPTHITRSEALMKEAIELAKRGSFVDIDTVDGDLPKQFKFYFDNGGALEKLTVSTDCSITSPQNMLEQIRSCVLEHEIPLEQILPCVTANTAKALKLEQKGKLEEGKAADVLVLRKETLEIKDVVAGGRRLMKNGRLAFKEKFLEESNRKIELTGEKD
jgi:beta-aspartyl-dipeptidase (metallo-type)